MIYNSIRNSVFAMILSLLSAIAFSGCQSNDALPEEEVGYVRLTISETVTTNPRATAIPADYNPKKWAVEIINNASQTLMYKTEDWSQVTGGQVALKKGSYTIRVHSSGFDGKNVGTDIPYYAGSTVAVIAEVGDVVNATVNCTLANVKVTVDFAENLLAKVNAISAQVYSSTDAAYTWTFAPSNTGAVYFPVTDLVAKVSLVNRKGQSYSMETPISGVKARDHYLLHYKMAETGNGKINITVDGSMTVYDLPINVTQEASNTALLSANAWSKFAYLQAASVTHEEGISLDPSQMKFQYKPATSDTWTATVAATKATVANGDVYTATIQGLTPGTQYDYRLILGTGEAFNTAKSSFVTDAVTLIPNGSFENWCTRSAGTALSSKDTRFPSTGDEYDNGTRFWDTSNRGANSMGTKDPTKDTDVSVSGTAAQLQSIAVAGNFAAASLFSGNFESASLGTGGATATITFGRPFTVRPSVLKGYYKYTPVNIDKVGSNPPAGVVAGNPDECAIYIALSKKQYAVKNTDTSTWIDYEHDDNIIAYGALPSGAAASGTEPNGYTKFSIPLKYKNLTDKPTHIIIVCSASKYGDYMTGGVGSTLLVDELTLDYDTLPVLWQ